MKRKHNLDTNSLTRQSLISKIGDDTRLKMHFLSPSTQDTAALFFFFDNSGEIHIEGRSGSSEEAKEFIQEIVMLIQCFLEQRYMEN
jgi:hypothetical protein